MTDKHKYNTIFMNILNMSGKALLYDSDLSFINDVYNNTGITIISASQLGCEYKEIQFDELTTGDIAFYSTDAGNIFYGVVLGIINRNMIFKSAEFKFAQIVSLNKRYEDYKFRRGFSMHNLSEDVTGGKI
ncbi:MAG: hypothetical protein Q4F95_05440 [Oscillospiraceae bacterium]|nr:hypothetical protein [Oscillospiraceae bacterium]